MPRRKEITSEDCILLHLSSLQLSDKEIEEAPFSATQLGISKSTGLRQDYASRVLRRCASKGLIKIVKHRVREKSMKMYVYLLTNKGEEEAKRRLNEIYSKKFKFEWRGKIYEETIKKMEEIVGKKIIVHRVPLCDECGIIKIDKMFEIEDKRIVFGDVPHPRYFYGRFEEMYDIIKSLDDNIIVMIFGMAGIGKTTLSAKIAEKISKKNHIFWHRFYEWDTLEFFLKKLAQFLSMIKRNKLRMYIHATQSLSYNEIEYVLRRDFKDANFIIFLDDVHKASEIFTPIFFMLKNMVEKKEGPSVIMTSRHLLHFYDRRDVEIKKIVKEIHLRGLKKDDAKKFLEYMGISKDFDRYYDMTNGHPLALELISPEKTSMSQIYDIEKFIEEEIYTHLDDDEKRALQYASIFRYPINEDALLRMVAYDSILALYRKGLILRSSNMIEVHDIIKDFMKSRLGSKAKNLHKISADYFAEKKDEKSTIECIYHRIMAEEIESGVKIIIENSEKLMASGYHQELLKLIEMIEAFQIPELKKLDVYFIKGKIFDIIGRWEDAIKCLNECRSRADKKKKVECMWHIGWLLQRMNKWDDAEKIFKECLKTSESIRNRRWISASYHGLGRVMWRRGKLKKAAEYCKNAVRMSRSIKDDEIYASACIELGRILSCMGKYSEGEKLFKDAIKTLEKMEKPSELSRAYNSLGWEVYRENNDYDRAMESFRASEKIAKNYGQLKELGPIYHSIGEILVIKGRPTDAINYFDDSLEIFKICGDLHGIAYNYLGYAMASEAMGRKDDAKKWYEKSISAFKSVHTPYDLAYAFYLYGRYLINIGRKKEGEKRLKDSLEIFKNMSAKPYVRKISKIVKS